jgi:hypothetical protein
MSLSSVSKWAALVVPIAALTLIVDVVAAIRPSNVYSGLGNPLFPRPLGVGADTFLTRLCRGVACYDFSHAADVSNSYIGYILVVAVVSWLSLRNLSLIGDGRDGGGINKDTAVRILCGVGCFVVALALYYAVLAVWSAQNGFVLLTLASLICYPILRLIAWSSELLAQLFVHFDGSNGTAVAQYYDVVYHIAVVADCILVAAFIIWYLAFLVRKSKYETAFWWIIHVDLIISVALPIPSWNGPAAIFPLSVSLFVCPPLVAVGLRFLMRALHHPVSQSPIDVVSEEARV